MGRVSLCYSIAESWKGFFPASSAAPPLFSLPVPAAPGDAPGDAPGAGDAPGELALSAPGEAPGEEGEEVPSGPPPRALEGVDIVVCRPIAEAVLDVVR